MMIGCFEIKISRRKTTAAILLTTVFLTVFFYSLIYPSSFYAAIFGPSSGDGLNHRLTIRTFSEELSPRPHDFCLDGSRSAPGLIGRLLFSFSDKESTPLEGVASAIKAVYRQLIESTLQAKRNGTTCRPVVLEYRCSGKHGFSCGGLGDRLRGVAAVFWSALLTNSVFAIDWTFPTDLGVYIDEPFMPRKKIYEKLLPEKPAECSQRVIDNEKLIVSMFKQPARLRELYEWHDVLGFEINSLVALESLLTHPYYKPMVDFYGIGNFNYAQLFSIALRIVFRSQSAYLKEATEPFLRELGSPMYDGRFGVQMRLGSAKWKETQRVHSSQVHCFVEEVANLTAVNNYKKIYVFVTADSTEAVEEFEKTIGAAVNRVSERSVDVTLAEAGGVASITHIDRSDFDDNLMDVKKATRRTFVDWHVLGSSLIDHLVISRSSFGETAAMMHFSDDLMPSNSEPKQGKRPAARRLAHNVIDSCSFSDFHMTSVWMEGSAPSWKFNPSMNSVSSSVLALITQLFLSSMI